MKFQYKGKVVVASSKDSAITKIKAISYLDSEMDSIKKKIVGLGYTYRKSSDNFEKVITTGRKKVKLYLTFGSDGNRITLNSTTIGASPNYFKISQVSSFDKIIPEISNIEMEAIEFINTKVHSSYTSTTVKPKNKDELKSIVYHCIRENGLNCDLNFIDTSLVTSLYKLFADSKFNGDISRWDVSSVTDTSLLFEDSDFNGDISNWDVSNVKDMRWMFSSSKFNGDISKWDVSKVKNMSWMFKWSYFNGNISNWNVSNVKEMEGMFTNSQFNKDISRWNVLNANTYEMFYKCKIKKSFMPRLK